MSELTAVRFTPEIQQAIDDWRRAQPAIPTKGAAIRALVVAGLKHFADKDGAKERRK